MRIADFSLAPSCPSIRGFRSSHHIYLYVLANMSRLEVVNQVVLGKAQAKQHYNGDDEKDRIMLLMLHVDGSFTGQGVVDEALHFNGLPRYRSGGCVHILTNNLLLCTIDPMERRSYNTAGMLLRLHKHDIKRHTPISTKCSSSWLLDTFSS